MKNKFKTIMIKEELMNKIELIQEKIKEDNGFDVSKTSIINNLVDEYINKTMKKKIITGITVEEQMKKAKEILDNDVIPREKLFQKNIKK